MAFKSIYKLNAFFFPILGLASSDNIKQYYFIFLRLSSIIRKRLKFSSIYSKKVYNKSI